MKTLLLILGLCLLTVQDGMAQTEFTLDPSQSMLMTGKGPGQDGTINPYDGMDCYAIVTNIGERTFSIRVQEDGNIIKEIRIKKGEVKRVTLLKGYELYLDPNADGLAKARVAYEKMDPR